MVPKVFDPFEVLLYTQPTFCFLAFHKYALSEQLSNNLKYIPEKFLLVSNEMRSVRCWF